MQFIETKQSESTTDTLTIQIPQHNKDDLLIAFLGSGSASATTYTLPNGWNILFESSGGVTYYGDIRVYYKIATDSEPESVNFEANSVPANGQRGGIICIRGIDKENPFGEYANSFTADANNTNHIAPSITTEKESYIIRGYAVRNSNVNWTVSEEYETLYIGKGTPRPNILCVGKMQNQAGETGTEVTNSSPTYRASCFTLALNPTQEEPEPSDKKLNVDGIVVEKIFVNNSQYSKLYLNNILVYETEPTEPIDTIKPTLKINKNRNGYVYDGEVLNPALTENTPEYEAEDNNLLYSIVATNVSTGASAFSVYNLDVTSKRGKVNHLPDATYRFIATDVAGNQSDPLIVTFNRNL